MGTLDPPGTTPFDPYAYRLVHEPAELPTAVWGLPTTGRVLGASRLRASWPPKPGSPARARRLACSLDAGGRPCVVGYQSGMGRWVGGK
ncbi:MAG: hypothetical protein IPK82_00580 [Polyangiaceae bacterium]|nr:hypothetical protein [Polyangiaceae bacterium]